MKLKSKYFSIYLFFPSYFKFIIYNAFKLNVADLLLIFFNLKKKKILFYFLFYLFIYLFIYFFFFNEIYVNSNHYTNKI